MNDIRQRLHLINTTPTLWVRHRVAGQKRKIYYSFMVIEIPQFDESRFYKMFKIYDLISETTDIESLVESYIDLLYGYLINKKVYDSLTCT